jgi:hypothetical protein
MKYLVVIEQTETGYSAYCPDLASPPHEQITRNPAR